MRSDMLERLFVARRERRGGCDATLSVRSAACRALYSGVVAEPTPSPCGIRNLAPRCWQMIEQAQSGAAYAKAPGRAASPPFKQQSSMSPDDQQREEQGLGPRGRSALLAVLLGVMLSTLDTAIANVALPTIAADLKSHAAAAIWVINAYQLAVVATMLPFAALGDGIGPRRVFLGDWCCSPPRRACAWPPPASSCSRPHEPSRASARAR